ncbi:Protein HEADING DATE 3A [Vitis vinifera]|uniref:Protein HEADING DATE 3A n=1 Tax=Vitis vinifera TaxID=29760 RepID=A0A438KRL9_VITVI|nr:Protein HEADING DATE 3A [Vitis vinifera]
MQVMVDPDAPSPSNPNLREYLHWLGLSLFPSLSLCLSFSYMETCYVWHHFPFNFSTYFCTYDSGLVTDIPATTGANFVYNCKSQLVSILSSFTYFARQPHINGCMQAKRLCVMRAHAQQLGFIALFFVLFRQLGRQTVYAPGWRQNFNTRDFAELYNLGLPVAAVYFNCQREGGSGGRRS